MTEPYRFALIGEKVEYSRSPHIFKAIFEHTGCEGSFEVHSVALDGLRDQIKQMIADGISGFSVTIPHKQSVLELQNTAKGFSSTILTRRSKQSQAWIYPFRFQSNWNPPLFRQ